jgi:hypothetical protein
MLQILVRAVNARSHHFLDGKRVALYPAMRKPPLRDRTGSRWLHSLKNVAISSADKGIWFLVSCLVLIISIIDNSNMGLLGAPGLTFSPPLLVLDLGENLLQ